MIWRIMREQRTEAKAPVSAAGASTKERMFCDGQGWSDPAI